MKKKLPLQGNGASRDDHPDPLLYVGATLRALELAVISVSDQETGLVSYFFPPWLAVWAASSIMPVRPALRALSAVLNRRAVSGQRFSANVSCF